jgi:hypothetical protein
MNKLTVNELVGKLGSAKDEATALLAHRAKSGDFCEWADMLVIDGVDAREMKAANDKLNFYANYSKPDEFTGMQWFTKKWRNT